MRIFVETSNLLSMKKTVLFLGALIAFSLTAVSKGTTRVWRLYEGVFSDQSFLHTTVRTTATVRLTP